MIAFLSSSPFVDGADRAVLSNDNGFIDRIREALPPFPRFAPGLGLTDVNVLPHYQKVKDNILDGLRLFEDITYADSWGECFYAFVDGTYLLIENGQTTLYGEAYRLSDGRMEQISQVGDVLTMEE